MEEKKNGGLVVPFIIVIILLLGLVGYICYDKFISKDKKEPTKTEEKDKKNDYKSFAQNMIKSREKLNSYSMFEDGSVDGTGEISYIVSLKANGDLTIVYTDEIYSQIYSDYKIAENVLAFFIIDVGQGQGHYVYFINEDGTVGEADTEYALQSGKELTIKRDLGYKNIVSVEKAYFSAFGGSGAAYPVFIDVDGNMYSDGFAELDRNR